MLSEDIGQRNLNFESYRERITNFSNEFELGLFLYILRRSLIWIMLCVLLALAAALIYLRYTAPTYESRTILQLGTNNNAQKVLDVQEFMEDNNLQATVELLRSRFFIAKALEELPLEVGYFYRGQILANELYRRSPLALEGLEVMDPQVRDVPVFVEEFSGDRFVISYTLGQVTTHREAVLGERFSTAHFSGILEATKEQMPADYGSDSRFYFVINSARGLVNKYYQQISVRIVDQNAKTIEITCKDNNPYIAHDMASSMANTMIAYDLERKSESAENILNFIESQKDTVFDKLRRSEYLLQSFKKENKVADMDDLMPLYLERTGDLEDRIVELQIERGLLDEVERATLSDNDSLDVYDLIPLLVGT
ncbi:MAG: hypothetical protein KDC03_08420, partial [Flavobacteriales bacterium]|nr:hypothetical protein [Flavobacteriales bacterium]